MKRVLLLFGLVGFLSLSSLWLWVQVAPLGAIVRGGEGPPSLVLLHGYGSKGRDWLQFEHKLQVPLNGRLVFPQGPLRGPTGARGWWWLNIEGHIPPGQRYPDFSIANPSGIKVASRLVRRLLDKEPGPVVLGGFSQGAMLSAEIAFQTDQPLAGLVLLGGTTVNEAAWAEGFAARRQLPIFIAHGRSDGVLPFATMERFQARLTDTGLDVTWFPFSGGHSVPDTVIAALTESVVPYAPKPDEPRTVALEVTGCSVPVPPIVDWKDWDGRAVFAAADPVVMCKALQMLRDRMAAQPIHFDLTEQIPDNSPVQWSRIEYIFAELLPRHPRPGTEASRPLRPGLQLCAEVVGRSHRFCVLMKDDGSDPYFLPGHRS